MLPCSSIILRCCWIDFISYLTFYFIYIYLCYSNYRFYLILFIYFSIISYTYTYKLLFSTFCSFYCIFVSSCLGVKGFGIYAASFTSTILCVYCHFLIFCWVWVLIVLTLLFAYISAYIYFAIEYDSGMSGTNYMTASI